MEIKELIEKGAELLFCHDYPVCCHEWGVITEKHKEPYIKYSIDFLIALNLIQKCPECVEDVSEELGLDEPSEAYSIYCTCHQGYVATEDRLVKAVEKSISEIQERQRMIGAYAEIENSPLGGNVVKEAEYRGESVGLKIAEMILQQALAENVKEN